MSVAIEMPNKPTPAQAAAAAAAAATPSAPTAVAAPHPSILQIPAERNSIIATLDNPDNKVCRGAAGRFFDTLAATRCIACCAVRNLAVRKAAAAACIADSNRQCVKYCEHTAVSVLLCSGGPGDAALSHRIS